LHCSVLVRPAAGRQGRIALYVKISRTNQSAKIFSPFICPDWIFPVQSGKRTKPCVTCILPQERLSQTPDRNHNHGLNTVLRQRSPRSTECQEITA